jgi:hypothetical protein
MEARTLKLVWLVPALALALLPAADAASRGSHSRHSRSGHSKSHKSASHKHASKKCSTCARDSHGRIHRSAKVRHEFMRQTGHPHGWPGHVVDHKVALECGGLDVSSNMRWQTVAEAKAKDRTERRCP